MTHRGTNCKKNASWGNGKSMYSMIFSKASDLIYDLKSTIEFNGLLTWDPLLIHCSYQNLGIDNLH